MIIAEDCRCRWRYRYRIRFRHRWHQCALLSPHPGNCVCRCGLYCPSLLRTGRRP